MYVRRLNYCLDNIYGGQTITKQGIFYRVYKGFTFFKQQNFRLYTMCLWILTIMFSCIIIIITIIYYIMSGEISH